MSTSSEENSLGTILLQEEVSRFMSYYDNTGNNATDSFFSIVPYTKNYLNYSIGAIPLKVIRDSDIDTVPSLAINVSDLANGFKHFINNGSKGVTFKVSVIFHRDDEFNGIKDTASESFKVVEALDKWIRDMTIILVQTKAINIPNGQYIITSNSSRKQTYNEYTVWDLEFTTYTPLNVVKYANDNSAVKKAIAKAKKANKKKPKNPNKAKLKKCNYKTLKYSKKKKVVKCVKYLQKILKKNKKYSGKIDGWFGKDTKTAVKNFQKKYKKKYKLKVTGKVDKATWKALCK